MVVRLVPNPDDVRSLFDRIAGHYDLMNRFMTFGRDVAWRQFLVRQVSLTPGMRVLDVATGTGDILAAVLRAEPSVRACGVDFSPNMINAARVRLSPVDGEPPSPHVELCVGDARALPFASGAFDRVLSGFLIRNVVDIGAAFAEQYRVLRPNGMVGCIDTTPPSLPFVAPFVRLYFRSVVPLLARVIARDVASYRYLTRTTEAFLPAGDVAQIMRRAGFRDVAYRRFMAGTIAVYWGHR